MTPSITAVKCFETLTTNLPGGNSSARKCTVHPEPICIVGVHTQPKVFITRRIDVLYTPVLALLTPRFRFPVRSWTAALFTRS